MSERSCRALHREQLRAAEDVLERSRREDAAREHAALRDQIAVAVLPVVYQAFVGEDGTLDGQGLSLDSEDCIATECYDIADAMLKAREAK